jgi:hypothetical protein
MSIRPSALLPGMSEVAVRRAAARRFVLRVGSGGGGGMRRFVALATPLVVSPLALPVGDWAFAVETMVSATTTTDGQRRTVFR